MHYRPYQTAAKERCVAAWAAGKKCPVIVAPTGAGKTVIAEHIMEDARHPAAIVHTNTLLEQTARRLPHCRVYTVQSLIAKGPAAERRRASLARHDMFFGDEGHHFGAGEWKGVLPLLAHARVFLCTATPKRADGTPLGDIADDMIVAAKYSELLRWGNLVPCDVHRTDISRKDQQKEKVRPDGVKLYLELARVQPEDPRFGSLVWRPGIHFEVTIEACESAVARYNEAGVRAALVCSDTPIEERTDCMRRYAVGELDMLVSPTVLAEGFDSPRAEVCVLRRHCDHVGDYMQRVGRVLRPAPGKTRALLIDITNASTKHGLPTDDRVFSLDGAGIAKIAEVSAEGLSEDEESAPREITPWQMVQARAIEVRDTLLARYRDLQAMATEYGYKQGWVWHRFSEATSLEIPKVFDSQYASVCVHCRHRVTKGSQIFWTGAKSVFHEECWFHSLEQDRLFKAAEALPNAKEWKPSSSRPRRSQVQVPPQAFSDDEIPF